jgi:hypothetical protein
MKKLPKIGIKKIKILNKLSCKYLEVTVAFIKVDVIVLIHCQESNKGAKFS